MSYAKTLLIKLPTKPRFFSSTMGQTRCLLYSIVSSNKCIQNHVYILLKAILQPHWQYDNLITGMYAVLYPWTDVLVFDQNILTRKQKQNNDCFKTIQDVELYKDYMQMATCMISMKFHKKKINVYRSHVAVFLTCFSTKLIDCNPQHMLDISNMYISLWVERKQCKMWLTFVNTFNGWPSDNVHHSNTSKKVLLNGRNNIGIWKRTLFPILSFSRNFLENNLKLFQVVYVFKIVIQIIGFLSERWKHPRGNNFSWGLQKMLNVNWIILLLLMSIPKENHTFSMNDHCVCTPSTLVLILSKWIFGNTTISLRD